jgi:hypothetical protein
MAAPASTCFANESSWHEASRSTSGVDLNHEMCVRANFGERHHLVGEDGAEAAWTLALHTMPEPDVLRRCLTLLRDAAAAGEAEPWQVAFLVDRLSLVERNVQVYGTTICRQEDGSFVPLLLEDSDHVDERRRAVGLPPLEQEIRKIEAYCRRSD